MANKEQHIKFTLGITDLLLPFFCVLSLWLVYWAQVNINFNWHHLGVYPQRVSGLVGVIFSPFLHGSISHLGNNSLALLVLLTLLRIFYRKQTFAVIVLGILLSGFGTWFIGRESYHIGASGLIYALVSFLFFKGVFTKYYRLIAVSLLIVFLYGSLVWYMFPIGDDSISWEGHLSGFLSGLLMALLIKTPEFKTIYRYDWEHPDYNPGDDPFMKNFDENGNFNPPQPNDLLDNENPSSKEKPDKNPTKITRNEL